MTRRHGLALFLAALALTLCACQQNALVPSSAEGTVTALGGEPVSLPPAEGTWTPVEEEIQDQVWQAAVTALPYDLAAFQSAADRRDLTDGESLRMKEALGITPQTATVDGVQVVYGDGGYGHKQRVSADGGTLICKGFTSLWVTTPVGTRQEADYCLSSHEILLTPDEKALVYSSGKTDQTPYQWQVYWCDLASGQTTALTDEPAYSYEALGCLDAQTVLCCRRDRTGSPSPVLVAVDRTGKQSEPLSISETAVVESRGKSILCRDGTETILYRWQDGQALEEMCTLPQGGAVTYWYGTALSPAGAWTADLLPAEGDPWQLVLVDAATGEQTAAPLPELTWTPEEFTLCWRDDTTLLLQLGKVESGGMHTATWIYTLSV